MKFTLKTRWRCGGITEAAGLRIRVFWSDIDQYQKKVESRYISGLIFGGQSPKLLKTIFFRTKSRSRLHNYGI